MLNGGDGNDTLRNYGQHSTIFGGNGDDTIHSEGDGNVVEGNAGNDSIDVDGTDITVRGGEGNDYITNNGSNVMLYGGDGNDEIYAGNPVENVTINGGRGNDNIYLRSPFDPESNHASDVIEYASGDGFDYVEGYLETDTIFITDGSDYSTLLEGDDVVIEIGDGEIYLSNAADKPSTSFKANALSSPTTLLPPSTTISSTIPTRTR